jgi:outer membrane autotransporter protein
MCEKLKKVKPYIGAGIGYSWLGMSINAFGVKKSAKDKDWGWNAGLGVAYELNDNLDLTLGYRYEDLGTAKKDNVKVDFTNHKVSLGLRYTF